MRCSAAVGLWEEEYMFIMCRLPLEIEALSVITFFSQSRATNKPKLLYPREYLFSYVFFSSNKRSRMNS